MKRAGSLGSCHKCCRMLLPTYPWLMGQKGMWLSATAQKGLLHPLHPPLSRLSRLLRWWCTDSTIRVFLVAKSSEWYHTYFGSFTRLFNTSAGVRPRLHLFRIQVTRNDNTLTLGRWRDRWTGVLEGWPFILDEDEGRGMCLAFKAQRFAKAMLSSPSPENNTSLASFQSSATYRSPRYEENDSSIWGYVMSVVRNCSRMLHAPWSANGDGAVRQFPARHRLMSNNNDEIWSRLTVTSTSRALRGTLIIMRVLTFWESSW
jgi:hypothetical protein